MRECKVFLDESNVNHVLDTYTQMCNISVNTDSLATMAATLANGGICPTTGNSPLPNNHSLFRIPGESVLSNENVKATLSCMQAAGMNDWSGQWAYRVGLPAKSGISGGLMIVVPNVMGIAIYSPLIDNSFNSGEIFVAVWGNLSHWKMSLGFDRNQLCKKTLKSKRR